MLPCQGRFIWGATAGILVNFPSLLQAPDDAAILLQYLLPLLLPFLVYLVYAASRAAHAGLARRRALARPGGGRASCLLAVSLSPGACSSGAEPGERYVPPRFEDGRWCPGTTVEP